MWQPARLWWWYKKGRTYYFIISLSAFSSPILSNGSISSEFLPFPFCLILSPCHSLHFLLRLVLFLYHRHPFLLRLILYLYKKLHYLHLKITFPRIYPLSVFLPFLLIHLTTSVKRPPAGTWLRLETIPYHERPHHLRLHYPSRPRMVFLLAPQV